MKLSLVIIVIIFLISCSGNANSRDYEMGGQDVTQRNYKSIIDDVIIRFSRGEAVSIEDLQDAVPTSEEEFVIFYSYTGMNKAQELRKAFYGIESSFAKNAENKIKDFFKLYLEISPFVDGEYAEIYFNKMEKVIEKNKKDFCAIFNSLNLESKKRLEIFYSKYCN